VSFLLSELIGGGVILATISIPPRGNWIANVFLFVAMAAVLEMAALLLMSLIALPVVITLSAALSVLWLLRFLLHPIATHPKGPIYAIAGLLVLVGQLLRFAIGSP
jgi:hypothetical protein